MAVHGDDVALQTALRQALGDSRVTTATLPDLIAHALPAPWRLMAHQSRLLGEVVVLRHGDGQKWAVLYVPTPVRGRPSTWSRTPPTPVPYAALPGDQRAAALREALPAWVGTPTEIVRRWIPTRSDQQDETLFEEERRISTGHLTILDVLLDVVPPAERQALEQLLATIGVSPPLDNVLRRRLDEWPR